PLRPGTCQFITQPQVQGQLGGNFPRVTRVKAPVGLFSGGRLGNPHLACGLVAKCGADSQAVTEEEVRVVVSRSRVGAARHLGGPGSVKGDYAAANVRLIIVVKGLLQLHTKGKGVPAVNLGELWGDIPLRIPVLDGALPLAARDERIAEAEARGHRCALAGGNNGIVGCRPAFLGNVAALIGRLPQAVVPAETGVDAARKCRAESV